MRSHKAVSQTGVCAVSVVLINRLETKSTAGSEFAILRMADAESLLQDQSQSESAPADGTYCTSSSLFT